MNKKSISQYLNISISGFTLIELLVVIAILGTLATLLVPNFIGARERARDTQRKSDLKQLQKALELFKLDQSPVTFPATASFPSAGTTWQSGTTVYMNKVPADPNRTPGGYYYESPRLVGDSLTYQLCACLENKADPEGEDGDCAAVAYTCSSGKKYVLNEP